MAARGRGDSYNKYRAQKITVDGMTFDSRKEANRFFELRLLERAGAISGLKRQVKFVLIPAQRDKSGKIVERECAYYADFAYTISSTGEKIVEDAKGYRDGGAYALFTIKRKLMRYVYGIELNEV